MIKIQLTIEELDKIKEERYTHPSPIVQKRLHTLYLKCSMNLSHGQIAQIVGIHIDTVTTYLKMYNQGGLSAIYKINYGTNKSELDNHSTTILEYFEDHPPHSINEAISMIEELTGIKRSPTQVRKWLKKKGFRLRKTGQIPAKADKEKQKEFVEGTLDELIKQGEQGDIHIFFLDAAHFVMGVFLCYLWSISRIFVKSSSGRKRYNVLGAVNAITKQIHTWTNTSYINADSIADFFEELRSYYDDGKPIYIILDNARYQKCQLVRYVAWQFNIKLVYLPPYSPNLNIIERLWKWTKKKTLYATYYDNFECVKNAN